MSRNLAHALSIGFLLALVSACSPKPDAPDIKNVAVLKLGDHELINQVETATIHRLKEKFGDKIKISQYNGNFQPETLKQASVQIAHSEFDLAIPITTNATAELVNTADSKLTIVFAFVSNPEEVWGQGKAKPGHVTGTSDQIDYKANVDLILAFFPKATRIGYLVNASEPNAMDGLHKMTKIAEERQLKLVQAQVSEPSDVPTSARAIASKIDVFLVGGDNTVVGGLGGLLSVADDAKVPVFAVENTSVKNGALAAYGVDYDELGKETANMAIDALSGRSVSELPVNYFRKTLLYVNKKAAERFKIPAEKYPNAKVY